VLLLWRMKCESVDSGSETAAPVGCNAPACSVRRRNVQLLINMRGPRNFVDSKGISVPSKVWALTCRVGSGQVQSLRVICLHTLWRSMYVASQRKYENEVAPVLAIKAHNVGSRCRWVVSLTPRPLYPQRNRPGYPLNRGICGPQVRSGTF
jgi:hypothetical protein